MDENTNQKATEGATSQEPVDTVSITQDELKMLRHQASVMAGVDRKNSELTKKIDQLNEELKSKMTAAEIREAEAKEKENKIRTLESKFQALELLAHKNNALKKFGLDVDDIDLISGNDEESIYKSAEILKKRYEEKVGKIKSQVYSQDNPAKGESQSAKQMKREDFEKLDYMAKMKTVKSGIEIIN